jgi:GNAT superfamily N-acetyltransferase
MTGSVSRVRIRSLRHTDVSEIESLWQSDSCDTSTLARSVELLERAASESEGTFGLVAEFGASQAPSLVGVVTGGPIAGTEDTWALYDVFVVAKYRRQKVGAQLMNAFIRKALERNARLFIAEVSTTDESSSLVALLQHFEFALEATVPDMFADGTHLAIYRFVATSKGHPARKIRK